MKAMYTVVFVVALILSGCSTVHVKTDTWEASYTRFWYEAEGFQVVGPRNEGWTARVDKVTNDVERLQDLLISALMAPKQKSLTELLSERK